MFSTNHDKRKGKGYDLAIDLEKLRNNIIPGIIPKPNLNVSRHFGKDFHTFHHILGFSQPAGWSLYSARVQRVFVPQASLEPIVTC